MSKFYIETNISEEELREMDYDKMLQLLNKKNQNFFFLSNKTNDPNKNKLETKSKLEKRPYLHFDFGNSIEDKRKALRQKIKNKGININVTKFAIPKKIDLAQQLLTKNLKGKEKSLLRSNGFAEFQNSHFFQTSSMNNLLTEYYSNADMRQKGEENNLGRSFFKNILSINKKNRIKSSAKRVKTETKDQTSFDFTLSDIKFSVSGEKGRKNSENYNFYAHLKNRKKDHERIFSARNYSKRENEGIIVFENYIRNECPAKISSGHYNNDFPQKNPFLNLPQPQKDFSKKNRIKSAINH